MSFNYVKSKKTEAENAITWRRFNINKIINKIIPLNRNLTSSLKMFTKKVDLRRNGTQDMRTTQLIKMSSVFFPIIERT